MQDKEGFYKKLKSDLEATTTFPSKYLYKFIVPTDGGQEHEVKDVFKDTKAQITTRSSKTGKFISLSISIQVVNADKVISYYRSVEHIKGIVSL